MTLSPPSLVFPEKGMDVADTLYLGYSRRRAGRGLFDHSRDPTPCAGLTKHVGISAEMYSIIYVRALYRRRQH